MSIHPIDTTRCILKRVLYHYARVVVVMSLTTLQLNAWYDADGEENAGMLQGETAHVAHVLLNIRNRL
jgi:hypothetical protein